MEVSSGGFDDKRATSSGSSLARSEPDNSLHPAYLTTTSSGLTPLLLSLHSRVDEIDEAQPGSLVYNQRHGVQGPQGAARETAVGP